jgi:hypothetical protein
VHSKFIDDIIWLSEIDQGRVVPIMTGVTPSWAIHTVLLLSVSCDSHTEASKEEPTSKGVFCFELML